MDTEAKMLTRKNVAALLGVDPGTLKVHLSILKFKPTAMKVIDGRNTHVYDAAAVEQIRAMFTKGDSANA